MNVTTARKILVDFIGAEGIKSTYGVSVDQLHPRICIELAEEIETDCEAQEKVNARYENDCPYSDECDIF